MSVPVYEVTFSKDFNGYQATEIAAFGAKQAAKLFALGVGTLSSNDQTTLALDIKAAQDANPQQPVALITYAMPDGTIRLVASPGQPNYGKG